MQLIAAIVVNNYYCVFNSTQNLFVDCTDNVIL